MSKIERVLCVWITYLVTFTIIGSFFDDLGISVSIATFLLVVLFSAPVICSLFMLARLEAFLIGKLPTIAILALGPLLAVCFVLASYLLNPLTFGVFPALTVFLPLGFLWLLSGILGLIVKQKA